jgi:hypothetical protein
MGQWLGWPIERSAILGRAAAALTLGGLGSDAGIRDLSTTIAFMQATPTRPADAS